MVAHISTSRGRRYGQSGAIVGAIAIGLGLGMFGYLVGQRWGSAPKQERVKAYVPEYDVVEVPVPERPVAAGTMVREIRTRVEKFPRHQLPNDVVHELARVRDKVTLVALPGGLPIIESNLAAPDEAANPVVGRIPPGMRAMTVRVDATSAVEGWARSGSVVDVLLIEKTRTTVIAEQVKVISAERSLSPVEHSESRPSAPTTVTLLVTQEQCLAINTAVPLGKIAFALRSLRDEESWRATKFSSEDLSQGAKDTPSAKIGGVVAVGSGAGRKQYALVDGAWIQADTIPPGFFAKTPSAEEEAYGG
jgi:Flp pilus assembly protein CpaB